MLKLFDDAVYTAESLLRWMKWEDDREWLVGENLKRGSNSKKGSDGWCIHTVLLGFWTLSFVPYLLTYLLTYLRS
jgi:hypothetical protein